LDGIIIFGEMYLKFDIVMNVEKNLLQGIILIVIVKNAQQKEGEKK
jgi:hypothetical protein